MNKKPSKKEIADVLTQADFWMGNLHNIYWHELGPKNDIRRSLVKDLKALRALRKRL